MRRLRSSRSELNQRENVAGRDCGGSLEKKSFAGQFMTATRFAQAEWCARKEFYTGPRNEEQEEKNPCRGLMGKKSKERVPVQVLEEGWDWLGQRNAAAAARASSVFCERKKARPRRAWRRCLPTSILLEPLQFGTVDAALEVRIEYDPKVRPSSEERRSEGGGGACGNRIISVVARGRAGWFGQILVPAVWARATSWAILNLSQIARMATSRPR